MLQNHAVKSLGKWFDSTVKHTPTTSEFMELWSSSQPTIKKILSIKISIFHTSAVMKLLQQKYKLQEDVSC
jgi:hypothetical protein